MYRVKNHTYRNTSETEGQHPNVTTDKFLSKKQINKIFNREINVQNIKL